jgi:hypothetical protein
MHGPVIIGIRVSCHDSHKLMEMVHLRALN